MGSNNNNNLTAFIFPLEKSTLESFLAIYPDGVVFTDREGSVVYVNQGAQRIFGYDEGELIDRSVVELFERQSVSVELAWFFEQAQQQGGAKAGQKIKLSGLRKDGGVVPVEVSGNALQQGEDQLTFFLIEDITDREAMQAVLYKQSITDELTGLFNRRYFDERISQEFSRASRYRRLFSVIIIDIDGFKQANDLHGHGFGDEMLVRASQIFKHTLRDGDTAYRYGGDEFAMILPETTKEGACELAERLRGQFAQRCCETDRRIKLSLSIGIASHPEDGRDEKLLLGVADRRMYHSKESGGNMITAYDALSSMGDSVEGKLRSLLNLAQMMEKSRGHHSQTGVCHSQELRALGCEIGRRLGLSHERLYLLEYAAMLHDIGTLHIPREILHKRDKLTESEWNEVKRHTLVGEEIISMVSSEQCPELDDLSRIVAQHHESLDGSGYPRGLKGDEIMVEARILAVIDAYSAMITQRPYREALEKEEAFAELQGLAGKRFDTVVIGHLVEMESSTI